MSTARMQTEKKKPNLISFGENTELKLLYCSLLLLLYLITVLLPILFPMLTLLY